jgi:hypothetical protein
MAVFAPIPSARIAITVTVNPGLFHSRRAGKPKSPKAPQFIGTRLGASKSIKPFYASRTVEGYVQPEVGYLANAPTATA